jgi:biotin carboxyl carrier protein
MRVTLVDAVRGAHRIRTERASQAAGPAEIKAMMPGRIVNVLVDPGDDVINQQGLIVVEAMKMENELKSPKAGKVVEVKVSPGQTVEKGEVLIIIE